MKTDSLKFKGRQLNMCDKCQQDCPTCQDFIKKYGKDKLYECNNCGHLYLEDEMVELLADDESLCESCYDNKVEDGEIASTRNPETYIFWVISLILKLLIGIRLIMVRGKTWSKQELNYLRDNYQIRKNPAFKLAKELGRTTSSVENQIWLQGLGQNNGRKMSSNICAAITQQCIPLN